MNSRVDFSSEAIGESTFCSLIFFYFVKFYILKTFVSNIFKASFSHCLHQNIKCFFIAYESRFQITLITKNFGRKNFGREIIGREIFGRFFGKFRTISDKISDKISKCIFFIFDSCIQKPMK